MATSQQGDDKTYGATVRVTDDELPRRTSRHSRYTSAMLVGSLCVAAGALAVFGVDVTAARARRFYGGAGDSTASDHDTPPPRVSGFICDPKDLYLGADPATLGATMPHPGDTPGVAEDDPRGRLAPR